MVPTRVHQSFSIDRRMVFFAVLICLCFTVLLGRLWYLQIVCGTENLRLSMEYTTYEVPVPAPRGIFYDRNGRLLVTNRPSYNVVAYYETLKEHPEVIGRLAKVLGCKAADIQSQLSARSIAPCQLYTVAKNVPLAVVLRLQEEARDLPGIEVQEVLLRQYLYGDFATHVFGYIREIGDDELARLASSGYQLGDMIGKTGLERTMERELRGENGSRRIERDRLQRPVGEPSYRSPEPGLDIRLTLDYEVQKAAEDALRERLKYLQRNTKYRNARAGAVIALDPKTGDLLAMASQPSFDPNLFAGVVPPKTFAALNANPDKPFNNRALAGLYPPASTFKPFTVLAALEEGKARPDEYFYCSGFDRVYGSDAKCWAAASGGHGRLDLAGGLKNSCNVVMYELGRRLGVEALASYARMFGFGRSTGIQLFPGDKGGTVPDPDYKKRIRPGEPWRDLETLHFSIGQGYLEVTPLQLALAYGALANGGYLLQPNLVEEVRRIDGKIIRASARRKVQGRVKIAESTRQLVIEGLNEVVSGGTAAGAFAGFPLDRYPVAGKTGTGQKRGYDDFALFACFAPIEDPQIVVVVVIEQGGSGSGAAAPVARAVLEAFFHIERAARTPVPVPAATPGVRSASTTPAPKTASPLETAAVPSAAPTAEITPSPPEQEETSGD